MNAAGSTDLARPFFAVEDRDIDASTHAVEVFGALDLNASPELEARIVEAIEGGKTWIVVDLTHADLIDSTTLGVLVGALRRLRKAHGALAVVCPDPDMRRPFELTGLDRVFAIEADNESAIRALRAG
jgi:anti-sigma B factor antagonist